MAKQKNLQNKQTPPDAKSSKSSKNPAKPQKVSNKASKPVAVSKAMRWLIGGAALVTLVMWIPLYDPFDAPKSWVLSIAAAWLLGWLIYNYKFFAQEKALKQTTFISLFFMATLTVAFIATDNKYVGFFGVYGRKTGLLAYLSFLVFFLAAAFLIRLEQISMLERTVVFLALILGIYGFFQHYKIDFINWNSPFNPVQETLGNPDFAGAMMAILLVLNFGVAIQSKHQIWFRAVAAFNTLLLTIVLVFSQVRQGLLASGIGITFIILVWIYQRNKVVARALTALSILAGFTVIAGLLKMGPLTRYFYKISVTYRGDYWRAAVRMFIHHPLFGVGLDRYGANFRQYRDATQSLRRGPSIVADAAHNVPLQLAATGGIFVLIALLLLTSFTIWRGVVALRNTGGQKQILVAVIFGTWITYQTQSLISIDNIGIAIWGYLLGGALIGLSVTPIAANSPIPLTLGSQRILSSSLALVFMVISFLFFQSEHASYDLARLQPQKNTTLTTYEATVNKPLTYLFREPFFVFTAANDYETAGDNTKAVATLKSLVASDPRFTAASSELAVIYSGQKNWAAALALDKQLVAFDPFNQFQLLQLGRDEKSSGNLAAAKAVIPLINAFAPHSAEAMQAQKEFGN